MFRILLSATLAVGILGVGAADAASKHKHHARTVRTAPVALPYAYPAPQTGPAWAGPNQCFTDEGYGRFTPCDVGRSIR